MEPITLTKQWLEKIVIDLSLCPFAAKVFYEDNILFLSADFTTIESSILITEKAIRDILNPQTSFTTCLIIYKSGLDSFDEFLDVYYTIEDIILNSNHNPKIQFASFHPLYQFEGTQQSDLENYTNRSPYPIIHVLRTDDVTAAVESHADIESVPTRNIEMMKDLGLEKIKKLFEGVYRT